MGGKERGGRPNDICTRERPNVDFQYSAEAEYRAEYGMRDSAEAECRPNMTGLYSAEAEPC